MWRPMTPDEVKARIESGIPGAVARVTDTTGGGDHFAATVVAPAFQGKGPVDRHRLVYAALGAAITGAGAPIHALALVTQTPDENQRQPGVAP